MNWAIGAGLITWLLWSLRVVRAAHTRYEPESWPTPAQHGREYSTREVFDLRRTVYDEDRKVLDRFWALQATLVAISLLIAFRLDVGDSFFGLTIPAELLLVVVPLGLTYAWARFGFIAHQLIENRIALWHLLEELGDPKDESPYSIAPMLRDYGFLDTYLVQFHPDSIEVNREHHSALFNEANLNVYVVFGGIVNGCLLGLLWIGANHWEGSVVGVVGYLVALGCTAAWLTGSHAMFAKGRGSLPMQRVALISGAASACVLVLIWLARGGAA